MIIGCGDGLEADGVGTEGDPGEQCLGGAEHGWVAAPVDPQASEAGAWIVGGLDVGVNVGAPEGIDRLFGIADQHQRGGLDVVTLSGIGLVSGLAEDAVEDGPLDRVGVLEFIDQGDLVALS